MKKKVTWREKIGELDDRKKKAVARGVRNVTGIFVQSAEGSIMKGLDGKRYIDFAGGIGIQNIGHNHPKVVRAIQDQAEKYIHPSYHVTPFEPYVRLAERLNESTPGDFQKKTMLVNSGAEANENAIKMARKYTGKRGIIVFDRAFHGRTLLTMSLTAKSVPFKKGFGPFPGDVYRLPYPYYYRSSAKSQAEEDCLILKRITDFLQFEVPAEDVAAVMIEPVQGEGGFIVPSVRFMQGLKEICAKHQIILIADEIQTGYCRTGKLFAMEHFGVAPDLMTMSKSMAAGMPLGAVTGRAEIVDAPEPGQLGSTLAGNPVACAAALSVLDVIVEENLVEKSALLGSKIMNAFSKMQNEYEIIGDVRGLGPMCAIELVKNRRTKEPATELAANIVQYCWKKGLIILSAGLYANVLRFLPPVTIQDEYLYEGLAILEEAVKKADL